MHEEIGYKTEGERITTACPHGMRAWLSNKAGSVAVMVGSVRCTRCKHFVSKDNHKKHVLCSYAGDMADKAVAQSEDACASAQGND